LKAAGQYGDGSSVDITGTVTWSSSNPSIATVSAQGLLQTVAIGSSTISAALQSVTGIGSVTAVTPFAWKTPSPITYGTPLGAAQLNATSGASGTYTYNPPPGTILSAGTQPLNVLFTPDSSYSAQASPARNPAKAGNARSKADSSPADSSSSYLGATATVSLIVNPAAATLAVSCPEVSFDGKSHTCSGSASGLNGVTVNGTWSFSPANGTGAGSYSISGAFTSSDSNYTNGTASGTLKIDPATPAIVWPTPSPISAGTALSSAQLNATATGVDGKPLAGTLTFSPVSGTVLPNGNQNLTVAFVPSDATNYTATTKTVSLAVQDFSLPPSAPSLTVSSPGQPQTTTFALTPVAGWTGNVAFACSVPTSMAEASCSATSAQITGASAVSSTLTVSTTGPHQVSSLGRSSRGSITALATLFFGLFWFGIQKRRRGALLLVLLVIVLVPASLLSGCGGANGGSGTGGAGHTDQGTPTGTYTLTVTATSGILTHNMQISVTVQ
jgi:hypothetical protein